MTNNISSKGITATVPRILIAGASSSSGKTTVVCALLGALKAAGVPVRAFKCGPDYIDPGFHKTVSGVPCFNLDPFFFDENALREELSANGERRGVNVIEGVMGYYDGAGATSRYSTFEVAQKTSSPVVLVINARGAAASLFALMHGFISFKPASNVKAVIFNNCSESLYKTLKAEGERLFPDILFAGYLKSLPECTLDSRRLGLITADETENLREKVRVLSQSAGETLDVPALISLAKAAPETGFAPRRIKKRAPVRIAVARDEAFCFIYEDSLKILSDMGAELVYFSPLRDRAFPGNVHGLYLCGGYPELYADALFSNESMRKSVREKVLRGVPTIAECGGFMYLCRDIAGKSMAGVFPQSVKDTGKLTRFGYVTLTSNTDNMLCKKGESIRAHEFHYWDCENAGSDFRAEKPTGRAWDCVYANDTLYAGFPHFHFAQDLKLAENFYNACLKEKSKNV